MIEVLTLILIVVFMGAFGQIYMKKGIQKLGGIELKELVSQKLFTYIFEGNIFVGLILYVLATLIWLVILSKVELSFAYPLIALAYVVTAFLAKIYFNENITLMRWFGILLIIGGAMLVTRS